MHVFNLNDRADDTVDGIPEVVCSGSLPKRVRPNISYSQYSLNKKGFEHFFRSNPHDIVAR